MPHTPAPNRKPLGQLPPKTQFRLIPKGKTAKKQDMPPLIYIRQEGKEKVGDFISIPIIASGPSNAVMYLGEEVLVEIVA